MAAVLVLTLVVVPALVPVPSRFVASDQALLIGVLLVPAGATRRRARRADAGRRAMVMAQGLW